MLSGSSSVIARVESSGALIPSTSLPTPCANARAPRMGKRGQPRPPPVAGAIARISEARTTRESSGVPSWNLALTILISLSVAGVIVDLVRPRLVVLPMPDLRVPGKLNDEERQARLMQTLLEGGSLDDAAAAAGVSRATLMRSMKRSPALRRAMDIASHGTLPPPADDRPRRERRRLNQAQPADPAD